jgi:hypothetical protein
MVAPSPLVDYGLILEWQKPPGLALWFDEWQPVDHFGEKLQSPAGNTFFKCQYDHNDTFIRGSVGLKKRGESKGWA